MPLTLHPVTNLIPERKAAERPHPLATQTRDVPVKPCVPCGERLSSRSGKTANPFPLATSKWSGMKSSTVAELPANAVNAPPHNQLDPRKKKRPKGRLPSQLRTQNSGLPCETLCS